MRVFATSLAALLLVVVLATDAEACRRCRRSSCGGCYTTYTYAQQPSYSPPSYNIIFNNLFPANFLAPQSASLYGTRVSTAAYVESPALLLDRADRYASRAFDLAESGRTAALETGQLALKFQDAADRRATNLQMLALVAEANREGGSASQTLTIRINDNKMELVQPDGRPYPPQQQQASVRCADCHTGDKAPKGVVLDGTAQFDLKRAIAAVNAGRMPPKLPAPLTAEQKADVAVQLCELHAQVARPQEPPLPEPPPEPPPGGLN
jgi:hypothetical protein